MGGLLQWNLRVDVLLLVHELLSTKLQKENDKETVKLKTLLDQFTEVGRHLVENNI
jgi:hypothetical protein